MSKCSLPPKGWRCTKKPPHYQPCRMVPTRWTALKWKLIMKRMTFDVRHG